MKRTKMFYNDILNIIEILVKYKNEPIDNKFYLKIIKDGYIYSIQIDKIDLKDYKG